MIQLTVNSVRDLQPQYSNSGLPKLSMKVDMTYEQMVTAMGYFTTQMSGAEWLAAVGRVDDECDMPNSAKLLARAVDELSELVGQLDDMYDDGPEEPSRFLNAHALIKELRTHIAENL